MENTQRSHLLSWQWSVYSGGHRHRTNLLVHILTVPVFIAGSIAVVFSGWLGIWLAPAGVAGMMAAIAIQGRTHRLESAAPAPFSGPLDVLARIFAEQWLTFPRFVLSGGFTRAWREADRPRNG